MQIQITTGRYKGQTLPVVDNGEKTIRAKLTGGGTICLPVGSQTGPYFKEVQDATQPGGN